MAEELLEVVAKLQSRLSEKQEPRKLMKTLKRLKELPMTVDILVETGVGKTVNSLRKHHLAGESAKDLVAQWKKLVPQSGERPSNTKGGRSHSRSEETRSYKRLSEPSPEPLVEQEEDEDPYQQGYSPSPPKQYSPQEREGGYKSDEYESPAEEPAPSPPRKKIRHDKPHKETVREHAKEQERRPMQSSSRVSETRVHREEREQRSVSTHTSSKHSRHSNEHEYKREKKGDGKIRERREKPEPEQDDEDEPFEAPTMSFESFLTYDAPTPSKKKKKLSRPSQPVLPVYSVSSKSSETNESSRKRPAAAAPSVSSHVTPEKHRKEIDVMPTLAEIPLPAIQPNYKPLPSIDITPHTSQRRKVPITCDEEDAGFTGRRFNSKMMVYSGSKTSYLPRMMTLFEQCIKVLQNNIDSIEHVGGVPYEILEPILERCTPEQLYRIEQCNPIFTEDTDELWMKHCQRDFKRETPQEYESWRELYLRLHNEREERLRMLTQNISSAHANKPKGRQVKMAYVNSVAKPPRDVRRRQEKFGTENSCPSTSASTSSLTSLNSHGQQSDDSPSSYSRPQDPSRSSAPSSSAGQNARNKPQVKKIAPMMAKTIKAFKNRFSRR